MTIPLEHLTIEDGIEIPETKTSAKWQPFLRKVAVGQSFLFSLNGPSGANNIQTAAQRLGYRVIIRKTREGWRCWRVE